MRTAFKAMLGLVIALLVFTPAAAADPATVTQGWSQTQHVVVTPGANPTLANPAALNQQIVATGLPIYVAVDNSSVSDLGHAFSQRLGHPFHGVIVVAGSHGIYAAGVQTPGGDQAKSLAASVAQKYGRNLDAGLSSFVTQFAQAAGAANPPASSAGGAPHSAPAKSSWAWVWWVVGIAALIATLGVLILFVMRSSARRAEERHRIDQGIIRAESKITDLSDWVTTAPVDVNTENRNATVAFADAKKAREEKRFSDAATYLEAVDQAYKRADQKVNPPAPHTKSAGAKQARQVPHEDRKQATITARTQTGSTVIINNNDYRTSQAPGYGYEWPGGMYRGAYFAPGWWPYSFWGPGYSWSLTDMVIANELYNDRWSGSYDYDPYIASSSVGGADYSGSSLGDTNWQGDTSSQGGGDYGTGSDNSSSDGGSTYADPDPTPDPDPVSYNDQPSYDYSGGGGDYGGGDSGAGDYGGGDSGGGGSDGW